MQIEGNSRTHAARMALQATGATPRQLGLQHQQKILSWIYRWGFTTSNLIQQIAKRTAGGMARRYVEKGWLARTRTASGQPQHFYTLTQAGLEFVEGACVERLLRYREIDPYKVGQQTMRHYIMAQAVTLNALQANGITGFLTEREIGQADSDGKKRPDITWILKSGSRVGIEIELSAKWARDADEFVLGIWRALEATSSNPASYSRFAVITDSPAIEKRYRDMFAPGAQVQVWEKDDRNHWAVVKKLKAPDWLQSKVDFRLVA